MKYLIVLITLTTLSATANAQSCNITLKAPKPSARSASINGVSFSAKQLMALRSVCVVEIKHLSKAEKVRLYEEKLDREEADIKAAMGDFN